MMPKTKAAGNENMTSSPARALRVLPQPGLHRIMKISVAPAIISSLAAIFPKRIFPLSLIV